ncbi:hypothetical protein ACHAXT_010720 [Thalassiosira profunda]
MPSPTSKKQKPHAPYRLKLWCARLALAAVPCYLVALFSMGMRATQHMLTSPGATTHPLLSGAPLQRCPPGAPLKDCRIGESGGASIRGKSRLRSESYPTIAREIAAKWNLTSAEAPHLLERQFHRTNDYNPATDFLHFHHIPKTGGTTLSDILNDTLGALVDGHRGILPGSERSGPIRRGTFYLRSGIPPNRTDDAEEAYSFPYMASYGHTRLRPTHGPNKTELASFFDEYFALPGNSQKRLRALGMLREPMNLRASTHAMAMCGLNGRVASLNWRRERKGLKRICTPEEGLNISKLVDGAVDKAIAEKCPNGAKPSHAAKLNKHEALLCSKGRSALDFCRGATQLLNSDQYKSTMRSSLRPLMGRFAAEEKMFFDYYRSAEAFLNNSTSQGFAPAKVEEYTLVDLGGLDTTITHAAYKGYNHPKQLAAGKSDAGNTNNDAEPDFLWFGITERMKESACLLYYTLGVKPLPETPEHRVMKCSPTSWWSEEHREEVRRRERADYAVWRAANAILDVRVLKMREDVRAKLEDSKSLSQKEASQYRALADAGCLD